MEICISDARLFTSTRERRRVLALTVVDRRDHVESFCHDVDII